MSDQRGTGRIRTVMDEAKRWPFMAGMRGALRQQLKDSAEQNGCSLSTEIEQRLEQSFRNSGTEAHFLEIKEMIRAGWLTRLTEEIENKLENSFRESGLEARLLGIEQLIRSRLPPP